MEPRPRQMAFVVIRRNLRSSLLEEVQRGVEVIVAKNGKPVARITKIEGVGKRPMGFVKGRLTRAFFEPLPDEELAELG